MLPHQHLLTRRVSGRVEALPPVLLGFKILDNDPSILAESRAIVVNYAAILAVSPLNSGSNKRISRRFYVHRLSRLRQSLYICFRSSKHQ